MSEPWRPECGVIIEAPRDKLRNSGVQTENHAGHRRHAKQRPSQAAFFRCPPSAEWGYSVGLHRLPQAVSYGDGEGSRNAGYDIPYIILTFL